MQTNRKKNTHQITWKRGVENARKGTFSKNSARKVKLHYNA